VQLAHFFPKQRANIMTTNYDQAKADAFKNRMFGTIATSMLMTTIRLGHELGLFRELVKNGPATSSDLAKRTELSSRHTYEWCLHAAANGVLEYNETNDTFSLPPEHATIMDSDEGLMPMICGLVENISYQYPLLKLAYQSDGGIFWGDMRGITEACKGFFKPVYEQLMPAWIKLSPSLYKNMTTNGTKVADLGCGCGISTRSLASNFPYSTVVGIDFHDESIQEARMEIDSHQLTNATARVVDSHCWIAKGEEESFDVITMFDCFHDMSDPEGVAVEAFKALKKGGMIFLIEPYSSKSDSTAAKLAIPTISVDCGFSACVCTPCGKIVPGKEGFGTTAGTDRYEALFNKVGFSSFETFGESVEDKQLNPTAQGARLMLVTK
jgi:SAM-dependent methyltransferase